MKIGMESEEVENWIDLSFVGNLFALKEYLKNF